ncbi:MAG: hypothetical protein HZB76_03550 [Chlamydiae bacterium]|nr:hypothetical protein [Chlamydiota bacterium]
MLPTIILRHRKENLKKCSLKGLEKNENFLFFTYPKDILPDLSSYVLLCLNAPILSNEDSSKGLFLVDGTWRYADLMIKQCSPNIQRRSLPSHFRTAYPRKQTGCIDPDSGLSSIEAIYLAHMLTNRDHKDLLDDYHWKEEFLKINKFPA